MWPQCLMHGFFADGAKSTDRLYHRYIFLKQSASRGGGISSIRFVADRSCRFRCPRAMPAWEVTDLFFAETEKATRYILTNKKKLFHCLFHGLKSLSKSRIKSYNFLSVRCTRPLHTDFMFFFFHWNSTMSKPHSSHKKQIVMFFF